IAALPQSPSHISQLYNSRTQSSTPAISSTTPNTRCTVIGVLATPSSPKRSITTDIASWPVMTTAVRPLAPSVLTASSATNTYTAPSSPPTSAHHGTLPTLPSEPRPPRRTKLIATSAAVPTRNENVAACTPPT